MHLGAFLLNAKHCLKESQWHKSDQSYCWERRTHTVICYHAQIFRMWFRNGVNGHGVQPGRRSFPKYSEKRPLCCYFKHWLWRKDTCLSLFSIGWDSSCCSGKSPLKVSAQGQKPLHSPIQTDCMKAGLKWFLRSDSKTSTLIGVRTWNRSGLPAIGVFKIGLEVSESGGRGRGRAVSDHSAVVGESVEPSFHRMWQRYFGWSPKTSFGPFLAVFAPVSCFVAVFASAGIELVASFWLGSLSLVRFLVAWLVWTGFNSVGHNDGRIKVGEPILVSKEDLQWLHFTRQHHRGWFYGGWKNVWLQTLLQCSLHSQVVPLFCVERQNL